jgi:hypothetical protein
MTMAAAKVVVVGARRSRGEQQRLQQEVEINSED